MEKGRVCSTTGLPWAGPVPVSLPQCPFLRNEAGNGFGIAVRGECDNEHDLPSAVHDLKETFKVVRKPVPHPVLPI